jgi:hypothetical protein
MTLAEKMTTGFTVENWSARSLSRALSFTSRPRLNSRRALRHAIVYDQTPPASGRLQCVSLQTFTYPHAFMAQLVLTAAPSEKNRSYTLSMRRAISQPFRLDGGHLNRYGE